MGRVYDMVIIGGGASGLFLAALLNDKGYSIAICEADSRVGKKLLMTGNGKCNMMNINTDIDNYNTSFVSKAILNYDSETLINIFYNRFSLLVKRDGDKVYPYSGAASTVLNALRGRLSGVDIYDNCYIGDIVVNSKGYCVIGNDQNIYARSICLASGSAAGIGLNSHGLLTKFGHKLIPLRPALLPILSDDRDIAAMQGLRQEVRATLLLDGRVIISKVGEMLFKSNALSGIVSFELSLEMARRNIDNAVINIDFLPEYSEEDAERILSDISIDLVLHKMIVNNIIKRTKGTSARDIAYAAKHYKVAVRRNNDKKSAQVHCGGLDTIEFDHNTMQSKLVKGIYAIGEALDVDGDCGGFNLQWAWASAAALAEHYE